MQSSADEGHDVRRTNGIRTILLVMILAVRLSLSGLVYARPQLAIANDSDRYMPIANAILRGTAYTWSTDHPGELLNTVGYPLFLAGVLAVAGDNAGNIAAAQLLLSGVLVFLLYLLLARQIGAPAAFVGVLMLALDPLTALWSMTVLTETLFSVALGLAAGVLMAGHRSQDWRLLVLAGLLAGMACLVKPFALLVAALWAVCLMLLPGGKPEKPFARLRPAVWRAAIFAVPIVVLVAPWFVRNALLWDCPTLSSVDRVTMRDYMAAKVLAETSQIDLARAQEQLQADDPGVCPTQTTKYWGIILAHPAVYARLHAAGTVPVLIATSFDRWLQYFGEGYSLPDLWRPYLDGGLRGIGQVLVAELAASPRAIAMMLGLTTFQMLFYLLALVGAIAAIRRREAEYTWIVITLVSTVAILVLTPGQGGHERFRVPVQPMLAMLVSYGAAARRGLNPWQKAKSPAAGSG